MIHCWLQCNQLCSGTLRMGWKIMLRYLRTIRGLSVMEIELTQSPPHRGRNHQILSQKSPLQAAGLLLWLGARRHCYKPKKIQHPTSTASQTSKISSKATLSYKVVHTPRPHVNNLNMRPTMSFCLDWTSFLSAFLSKDKTKKKRKKRQWERKTFVLLKHNRVKVTRYLTRATLLPGLLPFIPVYVRRYPFFPTDQDLLCL